MVLKFFQRKEMNGEPGGLDYLMRNPTARVIRGNPEITQAVIDASPPRMVQRFTAGVLNGCPPLMSSTKEQILIDRLEGQFLMGRGRESMPWCLVAHSDKGIEEKHIVIPNYDPVFRKSVYPYIDRIDRHGFRAWVEYYSLQNGLALPNDRHRIEPDFAHIRLAEEDIEFLQGIWKTVERWASNGLMRTREDLQPLLTAAGYHVRCQKHAGGPLEQPVVVGPSGKLLRLKGSIYYRPDFGIKPMVKFDPKDADELAKRIACARAKIAEHHEFRAWHLVGRLFGREEQSRVTEGQAKKHLVSLVNEKLKVERRVIRKLPLTDLRYLIRVDEALNPELLNIRATAKYVTPSCPVDENATPTEPTHAIRIRVEDDTDEPAPTSTNPSVDNAMSFCNDWDDRLPIPRKKSRIKRIKQDDIPDL